MRQALAQVILPDSIQDSHHEGLIQIGLSCARSFLQYVISLPDTLIVPGLRFKLWSVPAFVARGHSIEFSYNSCIMTLNLQGSNSITIFLQHALRADTPHPRAMNITHHSDDDDTDYDNEALGTDASLDRIEYANAIFLQPKPRKHQWNYFTESLAVANRVR
jgi:hypothetical protein